MTNMELYEGYFVNQETTRPGNVNIQQEIAIRLYDTESSITDNPFGVRYRTLQNADGTLRVTVSWDTLPAATAAGYFGYLDGVTWVDTQLTDDDDPTLPGVKTFNIPTSDYFSFFLDYASGFDQRYQLSRSTSTPLELAETPCKISVIDNDENKFTPVRSKNAEIQLYSSDSMDISIFAEGGDTRWFTEITIIDPSDSAALERVLFLGFLSTSDLSQEFLPDPNLITLTATDGLGFLNDEPLVTFDGSNPQNEHAIMDYIAWALNKTGQQLDITVCMNVRERYATPLVSDDSGDGHFYKYLFLDAKTFEEEIGVSENSYSVLEKILGHYCFITQQEGRWFILAIDEIEVGRDYYLYTFDWQGVFIEKSYTAYEKELGVDLPLSWMNDDAEVSLQRAYREVSLRYSYETAQEIPCNIDFSRGTGTPANDTTPSETIDYSLDCWNFLREGSPSTGANLDQAPSVGSIGVLRRKYEYGYEKERYLVTKDAAGFRHYFKSEGIPVQQGDKITIGFSWRLENDESITNVDVAHMRLVGDDGFFYDWDYDAPTGVSLWVQKTSGDTVFNNNWREDATGLDNTEWKAISATSLVFPVAGKLYIRLLNNTSYEVWFSDLSVENLYFTNGSFQKYTSQVHVVTSENSKTKAAINEQVFISDSPQRLFKGALLKEGGADYVLANLFYNASVFPNADFPDETYVKPFGEMQAFSVWNQYNRTMVKFEGTIDGLESNGVLPDLTHKYKLTDISANTTDGLDQYRFFQLLHNEINLHLCEWDAFFIEVVNTDIAKQYTGHSFKYLTG